MYVGVERVGICLVAYVLKILELRLKCMSGSQKSIVLLQNRLFLF